jgi:hypothetical protein
MNLNLIYKLTNYFLIFVHNEKSLLNILFARFIVISVFIYHNYLTFEVKVFRYFFVIILNTRYINCIFLVHFLNFIFTIYFLTGY